MQVITIILLLLTVVLTPFVLRKYHSISIFLCSPYLAFCIFFVVVYYVVPIFQSSILGISYENILFVQFLYSINMVTISILTCFYAKYKIANQNNAIKPAKYCNNALNALFLYIISIPVLLLLSINLFEYGIANFNEMYWESRRSGNAWKMMLGYVYAFIPFIYFHFYRKTDLKFLGLLLLSFIIIFLTGARMVIVEMVLMFTYYQLVENQELKYKKMVKYFIVFITLVVFFTLIRMIGSATQDVLNYPFSEALDFLLLGFDMSKQYDIIVEHIDYNSIYLGKSFFIDSIYYFMPHAFFPDKEMSSFTSRILYSDASITGVGYNYGIGALEYFNFGVIGAIFMPLFYYWFFLKLYNYILRNGRKIKYRIFISYFLLSKIYIFLRLGVLTYTLSMIILQVSFLTIIYFISRKISMPNSENFRSSTGVVT